MSEHFSVGVKIKLKESQYGKESGWTVNEPTTRQRGRAPCLWMKEHSGPIAIQMCSLIWAGFGGGSEEESGMVAKYF